MKKFLSLLLTGVMSAMLLAGCGTTSNDPDPASSSTPPAVEEERSITIAQSANFSMGFTPGVQSYEATYYMNNFYEGLVEYRDGEYLPCLATDWAASDDGLTYTFHLRDDVQFNDGTTFNAEAVKLYFDNMKPVIGTSANYGQLDMLTTEITVDDEYTVSFHLSRPYYNVLNDLSMVMPRGILSAAAFNEDGSLNTEYLMTHTPGTGPYMFESVNETEGKILYDGTDISHLTGPQLLPYRKRIQMIFQDPYASLDSRMTVMDIIREALDLHSELTTKEQRSQRVYELLDHVGLMREHANRYPHEFSGGQRQRIGIARALAVNPRFIICDDPVSALDVSIQAQIINLLKNLQKKYNLTYLFISHDLSVVEYISDTVGVMYLGNLVEYGATEDIFRNPLHPYTKALFSAIPVPDPTVKMDRIVLEGSIPSPANPPAGCKFHTRCANCMEKCKTEVPQQREIEPGHYVVCHLYDEA